MRRNGPTILWLLGSLDTVNVPFLVFTLPYFCFVFWVRVGADINLHRRQTRRRRKSLYAHQRALYTKILPPCCKRLGRGAESVQWAEDRRGKLGPVWTLYAGECIFLSFCLLFGEEEIVYSTYGVVWDLGFNETRHRLSGLERHMWGWRVRLAMVGDKLLSRGMRRAGM